MRIILERMNSTNGVASLAASWPKYLANTLIEFGSWIPHIRCPVIPAAANQGPLGFTYIRHHPFPSSPCFISNSVLHIAMYWLLHRMGLWEIIQF